MSNITPFVKRMRTVGGTIYVFSSATEDIGLNISERNNVVKMSNYALLNIPDIISPTTVDENKFNVIGIPGAFSSFEVGNIKDGGVILAESFQNYALNLEANLVNRADYDPKMPATVSERVFWKWLKETGAVRWERSDKTGYWKEEVSNIDYTSVVQNVGEITAGAVRYDGYGSYNETYVLVPSSYGKTNIYFKQIEDANYKHGISIPNGNANILGRENYTIPHPDALDYRAYYDLTASETTIDTYALTYDGTPGWWTTAEGITFAPNSYYTDTSSYVTDPSISLNNTLKYYDSGASSTLEFKRSKVDCVSIEYDLKNLYEDGVTFDDIAMHPLSIGENYDFNTILIYYSVYASKTSIAPLSTNLLGVLFLDNASGKTNATNPVLTTSITINRTKKIQGASSAYGSEGFGTSYSFRLNIKTDNMFDDTQATIIDNSSSTTVLEDFSGVLSALEQSVNTLNKQTTTINYISNQYVGIVSDQNNILNSIVDLQHSINGISRNITGSESVIPMFSSGIEPLVDSSIFVYNNNIGIKTNKPAYDLDVNGDIRSNNLFVSQSVKNSNGIILLGVGSYLSNAPFVQESSLGISFYWSAGQLLVSGADVSTAAINSRLDTVDSSVIWLTQSKTSKAYVDGSIGKYLRDSSMGVGMIYNIVSKKYDVSIASIPVSTFALATDVSLGLSLKANLGGSVIFTGSPQRSTTVSTSDNSNIFATTSFVHMLVDVSLNAKANQTYVDASLNLKSSLSYVDASLNQKPGLAYIDASLNAKSNLNYVDSSLNAKSNLTYVDASLIFRDASVNKLFNLTIDLSTKVYSPYISTNSVICSADTSVNIIVGNIYTDRSIVIPYTATRNTNMREGEIRILNSSGTIYVSNKYQENTNDPSTNLLGLTFTASVIDSSINLRLYANLLDANSTNFKYAKTVIGS